MLLLFFIILNFNIKFKAYVIKLGKKIFNVETNNYSVPEILKLY